MPTLTINLKDIAGNPIQKSISITLLKKSTLTPVLSAKSSDDDVVVTTSESGVTNTNGFLQFALTANTLITEKTIYRIEIKDDLSATFTMPNSDANLSDLLTRETITLDPVQRS